MQPPCIQNLVRMALIFIVNVFPSIFVSVIKPVAFLKGKYRFFIYSTTLSEMIGIAVIVIFASRYRVYAFAASIAAVSMANALAFMRVVEIRMASLFNILFWKAQKENLRILMKGLFSLSVQTFIKHLSTFWERTLGIQFLTAGYLASLNYSKNLNEIPQGLIVNSVLTTTYVEQVKGHARDRQQFYLYSKKMFHFLSHLVGFIQSAMVFFSPIILIVLFRHGKFDDRAVRSTYLIMEILAMAILPYTMYTFLGKTLYLYGKYNTLFKITVVQTTLNLAILFLFIRKVPHAMPIAILVSTYASFLLLFHAVKRSSIIALQWRDFLVQVSILNVACGLFVLMNSYLIGHYLALSNMTVFLVALPFLAGCLLIVRFYLKRTGLLQLIARKIPMISRCACN